MKSSKKRENTIDAVRVVKVEKPNFVCDERIVGRPNCLSEEKRNAMLSAYYSRPYSFRQLAEIFGVSRMTVWRTVQENFGGSYGTV